MAICSLIKEVALLLYVIGISQAERDLLDTIHLNAENPPEVNDFLHTVLQYRNDFRWIRKLAQQPDANTQYKKSVYFPSSQLEFLKRDASDSDRRPTNDVNPYMYELDDSNQRDEILYNDRPARNLRRKRKRHRTGRIGHLRERRSKGSINLDLSNEQDTGEVKIVPRSETGVQNVPGQKYYGRHRKSASQTGTSENCNAPEHVQHEVVWKNTSKTLNDSREAGEYYFTSPHDLLGLSQDMTASDNEGKPNRTCIKSKKAFVAPRPSRNVSNTASSVLAPQQVKQLNVVPVSPTLQIAPSPVKLTAPPLAAVAPQFTLSPGRSLVQSAYYAPPSQIQGIPSLSAAIGSATLTPLDPFSALPTLRSTSTVNPFNEGKFIGDPRNTDFIKLVHFIETPNKDQIPSSKQDLLRKDNDDLLENIDHVLKADRTGLHMYRGMTEQQTTRRKDDDDSNSSTEKESSFGMFKALENHPMLHNLLGSRRILPMKVAYSLAGTNKKIRSINKHDLEASATEEEDDEHLPDVELKFNSHPIQKFKGKKPTNRRRINLSRKKKKKTDRHYPYTTTDVTTPTTTMMLPSSGMMFTIGPTDNSIVNNPNIKILENADDDNNKNLKMTLKEYLNRENAYNLEKQQQDDEEDENSFDYNIGQQKKIELEDLTEPTSAAEQRELGRKDEPATPSMGNEENDNQFIVIPLKKQTPMESMPYRSVDYDTVRTADSFKVKDSEDVIHLGKHESLSAQFKKNADIVEVSTNRDPVQKRNLLQKAKRVALPKDEVPSILNLESEDYLYQNGASKLNPMRQNTDYNYYETFEQKREISHADAPGYKRRKLQTEVNYGNFNVETLNLNKRSEDDEPDEEPGNDAKEPHYKQKKVEENEPLDLSPKVEETETLHMDVIDPKRRSYADSFDYPASDENEASDKRNNDRSIKAEDDSNKKFGRADISNGTNATGAIAISITTIDDFQLNSDEDKSSRTTKRHSAHMKKYSEKYSTPPSRKKTTRVTTERARGVDESEKEDGEKDELQSEQTTCILISAKPVNISSSELAKYKDKHHMLSTAYSEDATEECETESTKKVKTMKNAKKITTTEHTSSKHDKEAFDEEEEEESKDKNIKLKKTSHAHVAIDDECKDEGKEEISKEGIGREEHGKEGGSREEGYKEEGGKEENSKEENGKDDSGKEENDKAGHGKEEGGKDENCKEEDGKEEGGKGEGGKEEGGKEEGDKEEGGKEEGGKEEGGKEEGGKEEADAEENDKEDNAKVEGGKEENSEAEHSKEEHGETSTPHIKIAKDKQGYKGGKQSKHTGKEGDKEEDNSTDEQSLICCYIDKGKVGKDKKGHDKQTKREKNDYEKSKVVVRRMKSKEDSDDEGDKKDKDSYKERGKEDKDEKDDKEDDEKDGDGDDREDSPLDREGNNDKEDNERERDRDEPTVRKHSKKIENEEEDRDSGDTQENTDANEEKEERPAKHRKPSKDDDESEETAYKHSKKEKSGGKKFNKVKYKNQKSDEDNDVSKYKEYKEYDDQASGTGNKGDDDSDKDRQGDVYKDGTDKRAYSPDEEADFAFTEYHPKAKQRSPMAHNATRSAGKKGQTGKTKECVISANDDRGNITANGESVESNHEKHGNDKPTTEHETEPAEHETDQTEADAENIEQDTEKADATEQTEDDADQDTSRDDHDNEPENGEDTQGQPGHDELPKSDEHPGHDKEHPTDNEQGNEQPETDDGPSRPHATSEARAGAEAKANKTKSMGAMAVGDNKEYTPVPDGNKDYEDSNIGVLSEPDTTTPCNHTINYNYFNVTINMISNEGTTDNTDDNTDLEVEQKPHLMLSSEHDNELKELTKNIVELVKKGKLCNNNGKGPVSLGHTLKNVTVGDDEEQMKDASKKGDVSRGGEELDQQQHTEELAKESNEGREQEDAREVDPATPHEKAKDVTEGGRDSEDTKDGEQDKFETAEDQKEQTEVKLENDDRGNAKGENQEVKEEKGAAPQSEQEKVKQIQGTKESEERERKKESQSKTGETSRGEIDQFKKGFKMSGSARSGIEHSKENGKVSVSEDKEIEGSEANGESRGDSELKENGDRNGDTHGDTVKAKEEDNGTEKGSDLKGDKSKETSEAKDEEESSDKEEKEKASDEDESAQEKESDEALDEGENSKESSKQTEETTGELLTETNKPIQETVGTAAEQKSGAPKLLEAYKPDPQQHNKTVLGANGRSNDTHYAPPNYTHSTESIASIGKGAGGSLSLNASAALEECESTTPFESLHREPIKSPSMPLKEAPMEEVELLAEPKTTSGEGKSKPILIKSSTVVHIGSKSPGSTYQSSTPLDVDDAIPQNIGQEDIKDIISGVYPKLSLSLVPHSRSIEELAEEEIQENDKRNAIERKPDHVRNQEALVKNLQKLINRYKHRLRANGAPSRRQAHPSVVHHHTEKKKQKSVPKDPCVTEAEGHTENSLKGQTVKLTTIANQMTVSIQNDPMKREKKEPPIHDNRETNNPSTSTVIPTGNLVTTKRDTKQLNAANIAEYCLPNYDYNSVVKENALKREAEGYQDNRIIKDSLTLSGNSDTRNSDADDSQNNIINTRQIPSPVKENELKMEIVQNPEDYRYDHIKDSFGPSGKRDTQNSDIGDYRKHVIMTNEIAQPVNENYVKREAVQNSEYYQGNRIIKDSLIPSWKKDSKNFDLDSIMTRQIATLAKKNELKREIVNNPGRYQDNRIKKDSLMLDGKRETKISDADTIMTRQIVTPLKGDMKREADDADYYYQTRKMPNILLPGPISYSDEALKTETKRTGIADNAEYYHQIRPMVGRGYTLKRQRKGVNNAENYQSEGVRGNNVQRRERKGPDTADDAEYYHEKHIIKNSLKPVSRPAKEAYKDTESVDEELKERLLFQKVYDSVMRARKKTHDVDMYKTIDEYFDSTSPQDDDQPVFSVDENMDNIEIPVKRKQEYEELQKEKKEEEDVTEDTGGGLVEVLRARKKIDDVTTSKPQEKKIADDADIPDISRGTDDAVDESSVDRTSTDVQPKVKLDDVESFKDVVEQPMGVVSKRNTMSRQLKHLDSCDSSYLSPMFDKQEGDENVYLRRQLRYLRHQPRQTPPLNRVMPFNYNDYIHNHRQGPRFGQPMERSNRQGDAINFREAANARPDATNQETVVAQTTEADPNNTPCFSQNAAETNTENSTVAHPTDICEDLPNPHNQTRVLDEEEQKKKEREDMRSMLNGDLPMNLINIFYGKLKDNAVLYNRFGGSITNSKECAFENVMNIKAFREDQAKVDIKHAEEMLHEVIVMLNRIVADQVHRKTCLKLSPNLKLYIVRITKGMRSFKKSSQIAEGYPLPKIKYRSSQDFLTPPPEEEQGQLLFEDGEHGKDSNADGKTEIRKRIKLIEKLLEKYQRMSLRCQVQVEPVRNYLMEHLQMLMTVLEKGDAGSSTICPTGTNLNQKEPQISEEELAPPKPILAPNPPDGGECTTIEQRSIQLNKDPDSEIAHRQQILMETQQDQRKIDEVNQFISEQQRENDYLVSQQARDAKQAHPQRDLEYKDYRRSDLNGNSIKEAPMGYNPNMMPLPNGASPSGSQTQPAAVVQPQVSTPQLEIIGGGPISQTVQVAPPSEQKQQQQLPPRVLAATPPAIGPELNKDVINTTVSPINNCGPKGGKYSYPELVTKNLMLLGLGGTNTYIPPFSVAGVVKEQLIKMTNDPGNQLLTPSCPPVKPTNSLGSAASLPNIPTQSLIQTTYVSPSSTQIALQYQPHIRASTEQEEQLTQGPKQGQDEATEGTTAIKDPSLVEKQRFKRVTNDDSEEDTNEEASSKIRQLALNPYQEPLHDIFPDIGKPFRSTIRSHAFKDANVITDEPSKQHTLTTAESPPNYEYSHEDMSQNTERIVPEMLEGGPDSIVLHIQNPELIKNQIQAAIPNFDDSGIFLTNFDVADNHANSETARKPQKLMIITKEKASSSTKEKGANVMRGKGANMMRPKGANVLREKVANVMKEKGANVVKEKVVAAKKSTQKKSTWDGSQKYKKLVATYESMREKRENEERLAKLFGNKDDDKLAIKTANKQMQDISKVNFEKPLVFSLD